MTRGMSSIRGRIAGTSRSDQRRRQRIMPREATASKTRMYPLSTTSTVSRNRAWIKPVWPRRLRDDSE